jgi:hypothetical protein
MSNAPLRPDDLRKIAEEAEMAKLREALARKKKTEDHEHELREAFMSADVRPDVMDRVNAAVRNAAQQNRSELLALTFPAEYCVDKGRAINNGEPEWPQTLQGRARKAYDFYEQNLKDLGYKVRAEIMNYPDGNLGEVGIYLRW